MLPIISCMYQSLKKILHNKIKRGKKRQKTSELRKRPNRKSKTLVLATYIQLLHTLHSIHFREISTFSHRPIHHQDFHLIGEYIPTEKERKKAEECKGMPFSTMQLFRIDVCYACSTIQIQSSSNSISETSVILKSHTEGIPKCVVALLNSPFLWVMASLWALITRCSRTAARLKSCASTKPSNLGTLKGTNFQLVGFRSPKWGFVGKPNESMNSPAIISYFTSTFVIKWQENSLCRL